ncbi:MAG: DUF87 domain-containing protein [Planctomycetes bacterium]|nr:DUF87 domain-containing protein [Planctomycetota bacterium]
MDIERVFQKLRPVLGPRLDDLWQAYLLSDAKTRTLLEASLRAELASLGSTFEDAEILLVPPSPERAAGDLPLGTVHYAGKPVCEFGLRIEECLQHIGCFGRSGAGKTNLCFLLLRSLAERGIPFLVFDWKRNYRDLAGLPGFEKLEVLTVGRSVAPFEFNPLRPPPGTERRVWLKKLIEIMAHAYFLGEGVEYLLQEALDAVYRERENPTLANVRDWLLAYNAKGRQAAWMDSALRAVGVLCFGQVGEVLNNPRPMDPAKLLEGFVVLELDALTNSDKTFLIESLLLWVHHFRLQEPDRERLKHVVVIEEAHHVLLRKKQEATGEEAVTDIILREIRELGEAIVVLDQHPSLISKPALGNTYTTFAFNLKHRGDLAMMADSLLLDREEAKVLGRLDVGWGLVKLQGRWHRPFLVRFPHFSVEKGRVTDAMLQKSPEPSPSILPTPSNPPVNPTHGHSSSGVVAPLPGPEETPTALEKGVVRLMADIHERPSSTLSERFIRCHLPTGSGARLLSSSVRSNLISSAYVKTPEGRTRWLELTPAGSTALGVPHRNAREGGPEHRYWVFRTKAWLESQGYAVEREVPIDGGVVDLVATRGQERVAVEVETGKSDALGNVARLAGKGFTRVLVVAVRDGLAVALRPLLGAAVEVVGPQAVGRSEGPAV